MWIWDYDLHRNWQPKTRHEWQWFLVRKINYGDFKGLKKKVIKDFFPKIKRYLDPGKKMMLENFLQKNLV